MDEALLDLAVTRILRLVERARPALAEGGNFDEAEHHALARRAAAESSVLLKNEGGVLPLKPAAGSSVAVIGEFARTPRYQGAGSSQVNPTQLDIPLDELRAGLGEGVDVRFAAGFVIGGGDEDDPLLEEAVALARECDSVVVFLGLPAETESEGFDRTHIELPADQPVRELKGFSKVALEPGESQTVTITLTERAVAFWSTQWSRWVVEAGEFEVAVGSSSRDLVATVTLTLDAHRSRCRSVRTRLCMLLWGASLAATWVNLKNQP